MRRSHAESRLPLWRHSHNMSIPLEEQLNHVHLPMLDCQVQRSPSIMVPRRDVGASIKQCPSSILIPALQRCPSRWTPPPAELTSTPVANSIGNNASLPAPPRHRQAQVGT